MKRKILRSRRVSNPDHPIVQPVASRYTDYLFNDAVSTTDYMPYDYGKNITNGEHRRILSETTAGCFK